MEIIYTILFCSLLNQALWWWHVSTMSTHMWLVIGESCFGERQESQPYSICNRNLGHVHLSIILMQVAIPIHSNLGPGKLCGNLFALLFATTLSAKLLGSKIYLMRWAHLAPWWSGTGTPASWTVSSNGWRPTMLPRWGIGHQGLGAITLQLGYVDPKANTLQCEALHIYKYCRGP